MFVVFVNGLRAQQYTLPNLRSKRLGINTRPGTLYRPYSIFVHNALFLDRPRKGCVFMLECVQTTTMK